MTDTETLEISHTLDLGALGYQPITLIGTAKDVGQHVETIHTEIRSVRMHVLAKNLSQVLTLEVSHLLDHSSRNDLHELLESKYRQVKRAADALPAFDFDGGAA